MIQQPKVITEIENLLIPELAKEAIELNNVEYRRENGSRVLRVFIDTDHGVGVNDCSKATEIIRNTIDDLEEYDYDFLEVSSPGIDRIIKKDTDFIRFNGEKVKIKFLKPVNNQRKIIGILKDYTGEEIIIKTEEEEVRKISTDLIHSVRLYPDL